MVLVQALTDATKKLTLFAQPLTKACHGQFLDSILSFTKGNGGY